MNKIQIKLVVVIALTIVLSSCSRQSNLSLIKRKSSNAKDIVYKERSNPLSQINRKELKLINSSSSLEIVNEKIPTPIINIVQNDRSAIAIVSSSEAPLGIDKNLYSFASRLKINDVETSSIPNKASSNRNDLREHHDLILYIILAILIPPLAVFLYQSGITLDFWIDLILTLCFDIPGILFALYIILR